jgi:hypothetical protein
MQRRWSTIEGEFGDDAWNEAVWLVRAGAVTLRCRVDGGSRLGAPIAWILTDGWADERRRRSRVNASAVEEWFARAESAASGVAALCPELAVALRGTHPSVGTLPVLVYAAEDLASGASHSGPRAFSQVHFGETKARDDAAAVLRGAGVPERTVIALGLRRSDRVGVAGPIVAMAGNDEIRFAQLDGPVLLRADQDGLQLTLRFPCVLVVIENLQAAEIVADRFPEVALFYTAGLLGAAALHLLAELTGLAEWVLVAVDADAGGVRIAEQVLRTSATARVLDAGEYPHESRDRWVSEGVAVSTLERALDGPAGALAAACLRRGYPVEQEATIVEAVRAALAADGSDAGNVRSA